MPSEDEWQELINAADSPDPVTAEVYLEKLPGFSKSVHLSCDDGEDYAVKAQQARAGNYHRAIIADQVVARLGQAIDAPVAEVALIDVPEALIQAEPEMQHCEPGLAHGCRWIPGCSEKARDFRDTPENRERFAKLAILYGLAGAHDQQVIYKNQSPHLAHSVDHGHFFPPGSGRWSESTLRGRTDFEVDPKIDQALNLSPAELREAAECLEDLTDAVIAEAVASVPADWGITDAERVALADYIERGRDALLDSHTDGNGDEGEAEDNG